MTPWWRRAIAAGVLLMTVVTVAATQDGREPARVISCSPAEASEVAAPSGPGADGHRHGFGVHPLTLGLIGFVAVGAAVVLLVMLRRGDPGPAGSIEDGARDRPCASPEDAPV